MKGRGFRMMICTAVLAAVFAATDAHASICVGKRMLTADVVAFDMPLMYNRYGAQNINGMMYALKRDTINLDTRLPLTEGGAAVPGRVALRPDKRPRPLVLRMGAGDCLTYTLTNLLTPAANPFNAPDPNGPPPAPGEVRSDIPFNLHIDDQVADRRISLRFQGTQLVNDIGDDGSFVGVNPERGNLGTGGLIGPGDTATYTIYAEKENAYVGTSYGATIGGEGLGGNTAGGLWAVLNVNPKNSSFYRSQLTREEMDLAINTAIDKGEADCGPGNDPAPGFTCLGQPILNYEAVYPPFEQPWIDEGKAGLPVLNMVHAGEIVHTDIDAIVAYGPSFAIAPSPNGPNGGKLGHFPKETYPLESVGKRNPTLPNRLEPFRELTIAFHDEVVARQAFPKWFEDPVFSHTLHGVRDSFMINYGSGGIGSEILANRLRVGPPHDCVNCAYEEFFLTFHAVGEVGMLVDTPANFGLEECTPALANCEANGPKANYALFPHDPSNVHHTYTGDHAKFRNIHAGPGEQHVFHLHNHQWLFNPNDDNSNYLDAQGLGPGSGYTYEINFGGTGNRNKTAGDAIFHCHFYPHFAQGMWEMMRNHDVFERGTELAVNLAVPRPSFVADGLGAGNGRPAPGARALPDGEIIAGTPIPAVVPLPGKGMPPMPVAGVTVVANPNTVCLNPTPGTGSPRLVAKVAGVCPAGTVEQATGSLASVPREADPAFNGLPKNPGYPFWIAGMEHSVGQRPPTPPLDMITSSQAQTLKNRGTDLWQHDGFADPASVQGWDGGLPRFSLDGYSAGGEAVVAITRLDFSKDIRKAKPFFFPEEGTDLEKGAMAYHAKRNHPTFRPDGSADFFVLNGARPVPGAPYNEPCVDDKGALLTGVLGEFFDGAPNGFGVRGKSPFNATTPRVYKAANVQFDAVFNKLGYHYPQQRIIALWQDVVPTINKQRPPEPMVLRMNTFDCTQYVHSNVVPKAYELDDYQVRTPTDIIGQHIHLPKWDLTSADGAANGWNYEDGTLSPGMVREVIQAINAFNASAAAPVTKNVEGGDVVDSSGRSLTATGTLAPSNHPFFGANDIPASLRTQWAGARSTMQRWFADPVVNVDGVDRGLGIIFTHDHYGPSTHQQVGLYATVLIEPAGSKWVHNETGTQLYTRTGNAPAADGGPTSWQAAILTGADSGGLINQYSGQNVKAHLVENYREFFFQYADFQHAYQPGVFVGANAQGVPLANYTVTPSADPISPGLFLNTAQITAANPNTFRDTIQPPFRQQAALRGDPGKEFPVDIWEFPPFCPGGKDRPCPEAISADDPGMYVVNYRNESLLARVFDPNAIGPDGRAGAQATGLRGDLAFAMDSRNDRAIPALNSVLGNAPAGYAGTAGRGRTPLFLPPITQTRALAFGDPFTPTARVFDGDRVHVKMQAGAHEEEHTFLIHGVKWLQAGSGFGEAKNSGWRNAQPGGISEQFSFRTPMGADAGQTVNKADYAYTSNASLDGWVSGNWGILRSYNRAIADGGDLFPLPNNDANRQIQIVNQNDFNGVCPKTAPVRTYDITAVLANDVLPNPPPELITIQDLFPGTHMGAAPDPNGGTLVYNARPDPVAAGAETGAGAGPLHDPTAILYVNTADLGPDGKFIADGRPVGPMVIRANAGDCVEITLRNKLLTQAVVTVGGAPVVDASGIPVFIDKNEPLFVLDALGTSVCGGQPCTAVAKAAVSFDQVFDLANGNAVTAMVRRDRGAGLDGMTSFNNNLVAPSPWAGIHPALVEYDVTRADGTVVGQNPQGTQLAAPGGMATYRWYAGHLDQEFLPLGRGNAPRQVRLTATPVEFGGFNLMPADKIKQGQKGMLGAGVVYPRLSNWTVDPGTTTSATVTPPSPAVPFRDFTVVAQKGASMYYGNSFPVHNILGEGDFGVAEDPQDMGHMAINYGTEPLWFRFGINPTNASGNAGAGGQLGAVPNAGDAYSNTLVGGVDPETAVFTVTRNTPFHMHVLMPFSPGRGSTFDLHGHVWQRDPYVCPGESHLTLGGKCTMANSLGAGLPHRPGTGSTLGSRALGYNPIGFELGGIESWFAGEHYEIVIPKAGGENGIAGDYLFRDHMGLGNSQGLWGILRVEE